jgi:hypothetical protein
METADKRRLTQMSLFVSFAFGSGRRSSAFIGG